VLILALFERSLPPCTNASKMTKVSLTIKTNDITNGTVIMDPNGQNIDGSGTNGLTHLKDEDMVGIFL